MTVLRRPKILVIVIPLLSPHLLTNVFVPGVINDEVIIQTEFDDVQTKWIAWFEKRQSLTVTANKTPDDGISALLTGREFGHLLDYFLAH